MLIRIILLNYNDLSWRDALESHGLHHTLYSRWKRWRKKGIFAQIMIGFAAQHREEKTLTIDATYLKA